MLGNKLMLLRNGTFVNASEKFSVQIPNLHEVHHVVLKKSRKYGFVILVIIIRFTVLSSHLIKKGYKHSKEKLQKINNKYILKQKTDEPREVSRFLKMMSDYKQKIRKIKQRIKEEEGIE